MNYRPTSGSHAAAAREADRCQADYFRGELYRQIDLLNEQVQIFKMALAVYERRNEVNQARRMQRKLRSTVLTRRRLADMLTALDRRFPRDIRPADGYPPHMSPSTANCVGGVLGAGAQLSTRSTAGRQGG